MEWASAPLPSVDEWLATFRRIVARQRELFAGTRGIEARTVFEGVGAGGDHTLVIDTRAEEIVFEELERLAARGVGFTAVSEERGEVSFGDGGSPLRLVIDPIDGSLNARRTLPSFALSIAVASGDSMADVELGFVHDFGPGEEFTALRGEGARFGEEQLRARGPGHGLEVVGLEGSDPELAAPLLAGLAGKAWRVRAVGSLAITLCYVAGGRFDAMISARTCRSVDVAAAQLIVREAGAQVSFGDHDLSEVALGLEGRYEICAALDDELLATILSVQRAAAEASR